MERYRAKPEDDAVLIVLCAVRDKQFGPSALDEVIELWRRGEIGRTTTNQGAVEERDRLQARVEREGAAAMLWKQRAEDAEAELARLRGGQ